MKILRTLLVASAVSACLLGSHSLRADGVTPPPVVVPPTDADRDLNRDLKNAPAAVKTLILSFDVTRDDFLARQRGLLAQLKGATPDERAAIREKLEANRAAFLAALKNFRTDLRKDLKDLKGKIGHAEFRRIIDAAKDASARDRERHRGTSH